MHGKRDIALIDSLNEFEAFRLSDSDNFLLYLFVTGTTPNSSRAVVNLKRICEDHFKGRYKLKVFDLFQQPNLAKAHNIVAAPTLLKLQPAPEKRILGDLSDESRVVSAINGE